MPRRVGCAVASVGVSVPERIVANAEIAQRLGVDEAWIERRTGIRTRRIAEPHERLETHATRAARRALERAGVAAQDVDLACTGFRAALAVGASAIEAGRALCVVVVGADFMSRITDPQDRVTAAVFADGAGAVVLQDTIAPGRISPIVLGADGAGADHIIARRSDGMIRMRGHETFREAVAQLTLTTLHAVRAAGLGLSD